MKRILLILLASVMLLSCACGKDGETDMPDTVETEAETEAETEKETEKQTEKQIEKETEAETEKETESNLPAFVKPSITDEQKKTYYGYLEDAWRQKIDVIKDEQGDDFTFLVQTDPHQYVESKERAANNAKALSHFVDLDFIAVPGDLIRGYAYAEDNRADAYDSLEELTRRYTENVNCPVLMTFGNHDTNAMWCREHGTATMQINQYDHYFMVTEKLKETNGRDMVTDGYHNHYYVDFHSFGIRVIMLNTTDGEYLD